MTPPTDLPTAPSPNLAADPAPAPPDLELTPLDPRYPSRLRGLPEPPATLTIRGGSLEAPHVVAVVGSRDAVPAAADYTRLLSSTLARAGIVVVSGGAFGIDESAHRGALAVGGRTWCVAGTGCKHTSPKGHEALYAEIAAGPGAMIWPFPPDVGGHQYTFLRRNRVLVALADAVVVAQAGDRSGALHAAARARELGKPLWVFPAPDWLGPAFIGSRQLLATGARPLLSPADLLSSLLPAPTSNEPARPLDDAEKATLEATPATPAHLDDIASRAHLAPQAAAAALLTLALENVVVEGPPGFFRRR